MRAAAWLLASAAGAAGQCKWTEKESAWVACTFSATPDQDGPVVYNASDFRTRGAEPAPTYSSYLALDRVLNSQFPRSKAANKEGHDEMLFIVMHQTYELWFKVAHHDLDSIIHILQAPTVAGHSMHTIEHRLGRINDILQHLTRQFDLIMTMHPQDYLAFRSFLSDMAGFQSVQFRILELKLGLKDEIRDPFAKNFREKLGPRVNQDGVLAEDLERRTSGCPSGGGALVELVDAWLARLAPGAEWWQEYEHAALKYLDDDNRRALAEPHRDAEDRAALSKRQARNREGFAELFDEKKFKSRHRMSYAAFQTALFIELYRTEPALQMQYRILTRIIEFDAGLARWRFEHIQMVKRIIGSKVGSGGSQTTAGGYLSETLLERYRVFGELSSLPSYQIPVANLPAFPKVVPATCS